MKYLINCGLLVVLFFTAHGFAADSIGPALNEQIEIKSSERTGAEVLWSKLETRLEANGHWQTINYTSIRINDMDAARDYGRIVRPFNHYYSALELDFAKVRSADGSISEVADDAVQVRVTGGGQDFYSDSSELVFSLPDILPGSIIEFQFSSKSKTLALASLYYDRVSPYWYQRFVGGDGWRVDDVLNHSFTLQSPAHLKLHTLYYNDYPKPLSNGVNNGVRTQQWQMYGIKGIASERWMPQFYEVVPEVFISSHKDWRLIADWTWDNAKDKIRITPEVQAIASSFLLTSDASVQEKTRAVYAYLQKNIRYVFAHLGRGGYEPHYANDVISSSYGDCKDQTILAVTLLNALGVEAYPAVVQTPRAGRSDTRLVSMIFDHMIVYIPETKETPALWMDTTGDSQLFPGVSSYLKGQTALVVDGKGGVLTTINDGLYENTTVMEMNYYQADDNSQIVDVDIFLSGFFEQNIRSWWIHTNNRDSELQLMLKGLFNTASAADLETHIDNADNFWNPVSLHARFRFPEDEMNRDELSYAASFSQLFNLFGGFNDYQTPESRQHRFVEYYDSSLSLRIKMQTQSGVTPTVIQSSGDKITPFYSLKQQGLQEKEAYVIEANFESYPVNLSVAEYKAYFGGLEKITQLAPWVIRMFDDTSLAEDIDTDNKDTAYALAIAKQNIDEGRFEKALISAKYAVSLDTQNGEAWYLLGLAQGLNTLLDESEDSFKKAESLGYLP